MKNAPNPQTIVISNFGGRLSRILNGDLNSGFAKFTSSFGYDPFSKPMNLTWFEQPTDISPGLVDVVVAAKSRFNVTDKVNYLFAVGSSGKLYLINPNASTGGGSIAGVSSVNGNFTYGAGMEFFGTNEKLYLTGDTNLISTGSITGTSFGFDGSSTNVATGPVNYVQNTFHPLKKFQGNLAFGNGQTIALVGSTGTVTSSIQAISSIAGNQYSELNPALPSGFTVTDLDSSSDGNYLLITASGINAEQLTTVTADRQLGSSSDGLINKWNGADKTITAFNTIPSYAVTALQTYLQNNIFFSNDSFGLSLNDGVNKILTLPNNKAPFVNATTVNGNFLSWVSPEVTSNGTKLSASLYYFGALDQENPSGLYRLARIDTALANGFVYQTPVNVMTNNKYSSLNTSISSVQSFGLGQHFISTYEVNASSNSPSATTAKLYSFLVTSKGTGTPQLGVYETQTQLFTKKIAVKQIRVYTEPTVSGNGFQIDCIGSDGNVIANSTVNYSFVSGTDITRLQGAQERIDFNPSMGDTYALGIRITNTGTTNMTIKKIEIDWSDSGK